MEILKLQEGNITQEIESLKQRMSIFSDTVTEGMEAKTKEVFSEPLFYCCVHIVVAFFVGWK